MLWLIWHMWILLMLAFAGGVIAGWVIRSRSDETPVKSEASSASSDKQDPASQTTPPPPHVPAPEPAAAAPLARPEAEPDAEPEAPASTASKPASAPARTDKPAAGEAPDKAKGAASAEADESADDLTVIKGLGPRAAEKLAEAGVTRLSQIAAWKKADIEKFDEAVNARGRIERDDWVGQAKALNKA